MDKEKSGLSINSVETGGGDFVAGDQHKGDIVQGNKDQSQGKTEIAGDMLGDISNYNTQASTVGVKEFFEPLIEETDGKAWPQTTPNKIVDEFKTPQLMLKSAMVQAEEEVAQINPPFEPEEFEKEKSSWFDKFKAASPTFIKGGLVVGEAVLKSYVDTSPVLAGALAAVKFAKGEV